MQKKTLSQVLAENDSRYFQQEIMTSKNILESIEKKLNYLSQHISEPSKRNLDDIEKLNMDLARINRDISTSGNSLYK